MSKDVNSLPCLCGSGKPFSMCCEPYGSILGLKPPWLESESLLFAWFEKYSPTIVESFMKKISTHLFRVSWYLDGIADEFFPLEFENTSEDRELVNKAAFATKHNILMSLFASASCLAQGLFLQSGTILRSLFEDCLVLVDTFEHEEQCEKVLQGNYSTNNLVSRVKKLVPPDVIIWYGSLSRNFTHYGPLHPAPYTPTGCYQDNYVLVFGFQNLVRAVVTLHLVLERIHFDQTTNHLFWKRVEGERALIFNEESQVFIWAKKLGKELAAQYPPDERKEGFSYDTGTYSAK